MLAQCVEAMTKKQNRIPYRESKMTRILSLGQNNGLTVMILNLAPTRAFNQDTLSALNFANRAKKIELKNTERPPPPPPRSNAIPAISGQAVRTFGTAKPINTQLSTVSEKKRKSTSAPDGKPQPLKPRHTAPTTQPLRPQGGGVKKLARPSSHHHGHHAMKAPKDLNINIEDIVEKKVEEILAARALNEASTASASHAIDTEVARRLEQLEKKMEKKADARAEGLTYILLAKQHSARGELLPAQKMYELALEYFPKNEKILKKISDLKERRCYAERATVEKSLDMAVEDDDDGSGDYRDDDDVFAPAPRRSTKPKKAFAVFTDAPPPMPQRGASPARPRSSSTGDTMQTPRTRRLLRIINSEDVFQIMELRGVGKKRAEQLAQHVRERREDDGFPAIKDLEDLGLIRGIGNHMVENMRSGLAT